MAFSRSRAALVAVLLGGATVIAAGCRRAEAVTPARLQLRMATAFPPLSDRLAAEYHRRFPNLDIRSEAAPESQAVIAGIERDSVDVGLAFADAAYAAYERQWSERDQASASRLRGLALLVPLPQYVVVRPHTGIATIADLGGRRIGVGPATGASAKLARLIFEAFGVGVVFAHMTTREQGAAALKDGAIDAAFFPGYVYPDQVTYAAIRDGAYLIPVDGAPVERLQQEHPFVRTVAIPRGIYPGQDRIIPTVGIDIVVLCRRDLDPSIVYDLTSELFDAYPRLTGIEATLRYLNPDEAPATPIPLHPGAARYFRERELSR